MISKRFSILSLGLLAGLMTSGASVAQQYVDNTDDQMHFYGRADLSVGSYADRIAQPVGYAISEQGYDGATIQTAGMMDIDSSMDVAIAIGAGIQKGHFRIDATYEYRGGRDYSSTLTMYDKLAFNGDSTATPGGQTFTQLMYDGNLSHQVAMVNFYIDGRQFKNGIKQHIIPYVGIGFGMAFHDVSGVVQSDPNPYDADVQTTVNAGGTNYTVAKDDATSGTTSDVDLGLGTTDMDGLDTSVSPTITSSTTAWMFTAGLGMQLNKFTTLDFSYRYLDMGDIEMTIPSYAANMTPEDYISNRAVGVHYIDGVVNEVKLGLRMLF